MTNYYNLFHQQLAAYRSKCSEDVPILELLWEYYSQENPMDSHRIRQIQEKLAPAFDALPFEESNDIFALLYDMVAAYQHAAFIEGIQAGAQLVKELSL